MKLEGATVDVAIKGTLIAVSSTRTKLVSEETFAFKGVSSDAVDSATQNAIRSAHRQHINDFKAFAEQN